MYGHIFKTDFKSFQNKIMFKQIWYCLDWYGEVADEQTSKQTNKRTDILFEMGNDSGDKTTRGQDYKGRYAKSEEG